jgi:hypothetical protein
MIGPQPKVVTSESNEVLGSRLYERRSIPSINIDIDT